MKKHTPLVCPAVAILLFFATALPAAAQQFVDSGQSLPGLYAGSAQWGYYDSGNYPDLLLTGLNSTGVPVTLIYKNTSGTLSEISHSVTGVYFGVAVWGDYDNDGDADIFVTGLDEAGENVAEIWRNNSGAFELDLNQELVPPWYSSAAWGDIDNDGLLDLVVTGMDWMGSPRTILYKNRKAEGVNKYLLEEVETQSFLNISKGSVAFGDYDNDGDLDLALSGIDANGFPNAAIYANNPIGHFVYDNRNSPLIQKLSSGSMCWGDADGDGYLDLLQTGMNSNWQSVLALFENEHNGRLGDNILTNVQDIAGSAAWGDFDNDGDFDIAVAGKDQYSNIYGTLLTQISAYNFSENHAKFPALREGIVATADFDNDGKLDIVVTGVNNSGQNQSSLYRNTTVSSKFTPDPPSSLHTVVVTNDQVIFSWDKGADLQTGDESLTYNIRVGIQGESDKIMSAQVPVGPGNAGYRLGFTLESQIAEGTYTWSVQTVNAQYVRSAWSQEQTFSVEQFVSSLQNLTGFKFAASAWGDYDNDGDPDLVIAGTDANDNNRTLLYINTDGILAEDLTVNTGLVKFNYGDFAWGDVDNDGDLDLAYSGFFIRQSATSGLYINDNGVLNEQQGVFAEVGFASLDWGDYDNDGDLDLAVMGKTTAGPFVTKIYKNEDGTLAEDTGQSLVGYANGQLKWADVDNDGDLDLAITGQSMNSTQSASDNYVRIYKNEPAGTLTEDTGQNLPRFQSSSFTWADLDDDGDLDMIVCGWNDDVSNVKTAVYRNNPTGTFSEDAALSAGLAGVYGGSLAAGDYDNDGDPDLVISGFDLSLPVLNVYKNNQTYFSGEVLHILDDRGVYFSSISLVDIDSDGDLELATIGQTTTDGINFSAASNVYDNVNSRSNPNTPPQKPAGLAASVSSGTATLTWSPAQDLPIGDPLRDFQTYQVRVGLSSGGDEIVSGMIHPVIGTYGSLTTRVVTGLTSGDYYWSVRAVDNGLAASEWAIQKMFRVDTDPPSVDNTSLTATPDSAGIGTITILLNITENFELDNSLEPLISAMFPGGTNIRVPMLSYSGKTWIGELSVLSSYPSGAVDFAIGAITDAVGNVMTPTTVTGRLYVDTDRPGITETLPEADQLSVPTNITLTAVFNEPLNPASIDNTVMILKRGSEEITPASDVQLSSDGMTLSRLYSGLAGDAEFSAVVVAKVQDRVGNGMEEYYSWLFRTAKVVSALSGGAIANTDSSVILYFSPTALGSDAEVPINPVTPGVLPQDVTFVDVAYHIGPADDLTLNKPSKLVIKYDEDFMTQVTEDKFAIYHQDGNNPASWERIGGTVDPLANSVTASVERLGTFGLFEDLAGVAGAESISDITFTPRVFAPKGTGFLPRETSINFVLGSDMSVTILIFNSSGRLVRRLMDNRTLNGGRQSVVWNGEDYDNRILPSGLYTVVIKSGGKTEMKTVAISNK